MKPLADHDHPAVQAKARELTAGEATIRGKLAGIFAYVRDGVAFHFPVEGDLVPASRTIATGRGQCNTKSTLFLALCRAAGVPARIHFSLIRKEIQRGLFRGLPYRLMPERISHSWVEVEVNGRWTRIDSFINDAPFHRGAVAELARRGWLTGFSVTREGGDPCHELSLDEERFEQMAAVTDDHGIWDDPAEYYATDRYRNRPSALELLVYRLVVGGANRRVAALRRRGDPAVPALVGRLRDERSREVVFLSHCLLNENTRYLGGACRGGCVRELVESCLDAELGIVQMPCPEQAAWGGVLKRWMLRVYGAGRGSARAGWVVDRLVPLAVGYTRWVYGRLARRVARQVDDYSRSGFAVRAIVGVDGSPSCGVHRTMDIPAAARGIARLDPSTLTVAEHNALVRRHACPGPGLFTEALGRALSRTGHGDVPVLAHDLADELDGGHASATLLSRAGLARDRAEAR